MSEAPMNPLYEFRLKHMYQPKARPVVEAPAPWRMRRYMSELDEILDATGYTIAVCRPEHAARIVEAVNGAEKAS